MREEREEEEEEEDEEEEEEKRKRGHTTGSYGRGDWTVTGLDSGKYIFPTLEKRGLVRCWCPSCCSAF